jgi:hypothetical protein
MVGHDLTKTEIAYVTMKLIPQSIRNAVLEDRAFREEFGLSVDAVIRLDKSDQQFDRSKLFTAIRLLFSDGADVVEVQAKDDLVWKLRLQSDGESITLFKEDAEIAIPNFVCLDPNSQRRLAWFDKEAQKYGLTDTRSRNWREILKVRAVDNEEVDQLLSEIRLTPLYVAGAIANHLRGETLSIFSLVPSEIQYYDRLVGDPGDAADLRSFVEGRAKERFESWLKHPLEGLKRALLLSSQSWFSAAIPIGEISREEVLTVYKWLEQHGDRISQLGALEAGLAHLDTYPELEPILAKLAEDFVNDATDDPEGRLILLCSLAVLVEGEFARTGIARNRPTYWRRLAAIAHASVIEREVVAAGIPSSVIRNWAFPSRGQLYYLQNFVDLRTEPRWLPDFILPKQLKAEFVGRIYTAGLLNAAKLQTGQLKSYLSDDALGPVKSLVQFPFAYLAGPLEGGIESVVEMPADLVEELKQGLEAEDLTGQAFIGLVNSPLIFKLGPQLAQLAAQALRRAKYQLRKMKAEKDAFSLLSGLATVAAVTRSSELADEVRILARVLRRRPGVEIAPEDALRIALVAAASHPDKAHWCKFVGDWLIELAYEDMSHEKAVNLYQLVGILSLLEPNLWETCARAEAALAAYVQSSAA